MKLKVGIIGCGSMASHIDDQVPSDARGGMRKPYAIAGGFAKVDETQMVAACNHTEPKLRAFQEKWNVPRGYTDYRELIDREQPDILAIATRPQQHAEAMIYGAEHGVKGMYGEKPLCCSLDEADAIKEAFERNGVFLEFGPMRRSWAVFRQARAIAAGGELGPVKGVLAFAAKSCGGHFLDDVLYLLGDPNPRAIRASLTKLIPCDDDTTNMCFKDDPPLETAFVEFDNGTTLHQINAPIRAEYEIVCENGMIRLQNDGESIYVRKGDGRRNSYDPIEVEPVEHYCGTERKIRELVESISTGKPGISNLRATMLGTEIGFGFYESHLQGGAVVRPPVPHRSRYVSSW